jgi:nucleoside-diphosphate kinase
MVKPDGVLRGQVGEVIKRIEDKGLKISGLKLVWVDREQAEKHYAEHKGQPYFDLLATYVSSAPSVVMVIEGRKAVDVVRRLVGSTDPAEAEPGTMRGDLAIERQTVIFNLVHASDSPEAAEREIGLYFDDSEIHAYSLPSESIYKV